MGPGDENFQVPRPFFVAMCRCNRYVIKGGVVRRAPRFFFDSAYYKRQG